MGKLPSSSRHMRFWLSCPFLVRLRRSMLPHPLSFHASLSDLNPSMSAQAGRTCAMDAPRPNPTLAGLGLLSQDFRPSPSDLPRPRAHMIVSFMPLRWLLGALADGLAVRLYMPESAVGVGEGWGE
ncbi:hypothetical protein LX36DRAFT_31179 [Colletotrichum falcatum]|nr:hypothetical protein LX36DRAFT_31179 [Colletotrichum falcatum]